MARLRDFTAATPEPEGDVVRRLSCDSDSRRPEFIAARPRPVARWTIDQSTGRPVCHWIVSR